MVNFHIASPAANVIQFTCTTRRDRSIFGSVVVSALFFVFRAVIAAVILLILGAKIAIHNPLGILPDAVVHKLSWTTTLVSMGLALALLLYRGHEEESFLVMQGLGVQTTSSSPFFFASSSRFFPSSTVKDVVINEGFIGFEVRHYLALIVEGEHQLIVVFPRLLPRRKIIERVWRMSRACLYHEISA